MTVLQPPKPISEMTPEELEAWEDLLEEHAETHSHDCWDTLNLLRISLNKSQIEGMSMIKKSSKYGLNCPYYLKAKTLFLQREAGDILSLLEQLLQELPEHYKKQIKESL